MMRDVVVLLVVLCGVHAQARYPMPQPPPHHYQHQQYRPGFRPRPPGPGGRPFDNREEGNPPIIFEGQQPESTSDSPMKVIYSWRTVDFTFQNDGDRERMIQTRQFVPLNCLVLDVDVYETSQGRNRKLFVTLPRVRPGVPVTLATVSQRRRNGQYLLAPYPDWPSQNRGPGNCGNGITSVFRTHVDPCGRLWVLDSGNNNAFAGNGSIVCPPQILIYDVKNNDRLIGRYTIPSNLVEATSLFVTIAVDTRRPDCSDAYAYIADSLAYRMLVFNLRTQQFWRLSSILFMPFPDQSRFTVNGVSFDLSGGVFGLAIGPTYRNTQKRRLYFHSIDSVKQAWTDTANLRNQSMWARDTPAGVGANPRAFHLFSGERSSQSAAATMNSEGIMFFGLIGSNEIACWNSQQPFVKRNLISLAKDNVNLQFNSGIKIYHEKLYAATSRLQNYMTNRVNENEVNYRILEGDVVRMTRGTKCEFDVINTRFDEEYEPDSESVDQPVISDFSFAT